MIEFWLSLPSVEIDRDRMGGKPVLKGTRFPVHTLLSYILTDSLDTFLEDYDHLDRDLVLQFMNELAHAANTAYKVHTRRDPPEPGDYIFLRHMNRICVCRVSSVTFRHEIGHQIRVEENPDQVYSWSYLLEKQDEYRNSFHAPKP
jgi:uncharacterized protein (DUF433 family)